MSNSNLVNYTRISPNKNSPRKYPITKITIHHMAGNLTVEQCGAVFANAARQASSNYGIGSDGRVGLYVDEADRSWCSGNRDNDERAVTIEVANDVNGEPWSVSDKAMTSLIELCADICRRNGIGRLNYTGDKNGNLTMHRFFQATGCPGDWLAAKFPMIADEVNKRLAAEEAPAPPYDIPEAGDEPQSDEPSVWAKDAVKWAVEKGLLIGDGNGKLRPREYITREELCVILKRALG